MAAPSVPASPAAHRAVGGAGSTGVPPGMDATARWRQVSRLGAWSRTWRYLAAAAIAFVLWSVVSLDLMEQSAGASQAQEVALAGAALLDGLLGIVALALLPLRRRRPVLVASLIAALSAFSVAAVGAAALAAVSVATRRRWPGVVVVGGVWLSATTLYEAVYRPYLLEGSAESAGWALLSGAFAVVVYAMCVATGFYVGARRELIITLHERADTAEREQVLRTDAAREAERTRIAREMHDVLAHRISLVAMQAGALSYRQDLPAAQVRQSAEVIRDNAHRSLGELRDILGVLRDPTAHTEPPQPTLTELPVLLTDERQAGTSLHLDLTGLPGASVEALRAVPAGLGRTAFRIIQEGLTNARKHAPGAVVRVQLAGTPGDRLDVELRNDAGSHHGAGTASGMGLTGLVERAELTGGTLHHGWHDNGDFVLSASLPWPATPGHGQDNVVMP